MHITIIAVGRMKSGPERAMVDDYISRASKSARGLGFRSVTEIEVESGGGLAREGERLLAKIPAGAAVYRMDEHGASLTSKAFAKRLADLRDQGRGDICFLIGGAEGYADAVKSAAPQTIAYGDQTWPHRLVRVMLAEQIYRAVSILSGSPYHKA